MTSGRFFSCCLLLLASIGLLRAEEPANPSVAAEVDRLVAAAAGQPLAPRSDDWEFCRRLYLDLAGRIPTADELQAFTDDQAAEKRTALIDRLVQSPDFPKRLSTFLDVHLMERLGEDPEWSRFLEDAAGRNLPWDKLVRTILNPPEDNEVERGAGYFLSRRLENYGQNPVDLPGLTRDVGRLFLGVDLQCAQCHDHLFIDDYKQLEFQGLHSFLAHTFLRQDVKFPAVGEKVVTQKTEFASVFVKEPHTTGPRLPFGAEVEIMTFAQGEDFALPPDKKTRFPGRPRFSPLAILAERLPSADNPWFVRNGVNRFWAMLMGRGLVHPLDLHHSGNPPSHPEVLDLLAREFAAHEFDIRWLLRELALTETYQRTSVLPGGLTQEPPLDRYIVALEKPLSAEQLATCVWQATGHQDAPPATVKKKFITAFANPPREPEEQFAPSVKAALFLSHDAEVLSWLNPKDGNLAAQLGTEQDSDRLVDGAFKAVLSRPASEDEAAAAQLLSQKSDRGKAIGQLIWALLNTTEFAVNH